MNITNFDQDDISIIIITGFISSTGKYQLKDKDFNKLPQNIECNDSKYTLKKIEKKSISARCAWSFEATYS